RLLDVYWRADDPAALVEVAAELVDRSGLRDAAPAQSLGRAIIAAALVGDAKLAGELVAAIGDGAPAAVAGALAELVHRPPGNRPVGADLHGDDAAAARVRPRVTRRDRARDRRERRPHHR